MNEEEITKYIKENYKADGSWICSLCENQFKGMPKYFLSKEELDCPLCKECFELSSRPPPYTFKVNGELYFYKDEVK